MAIRQWWGLGLGLGLGLLGASSCGGGDDTTEGSGDPCVRAPDEDVQCAASADTPDFYLCETDGQTAPAAGCVPLGDTGDLCCPAAAAGTGGAGGTDGTGGTATGGAGGGTDWWQPEAGVTWDWQLTDPIDLSGTVDVYDIDWETDAATVTDLKARGIRVICYVSVGTYEDGRSDAADYPADVIGPLWPEWDEYFVDIRAAAVRDIVARRMDACAEKGFDALEPDNMDVFELGADSGFPLTEADGLDYAEWLAAEAHARGLAIVQKNASSLTADLVDLYDGALTEDCFADEWCEEVAAYAEAEKPVFMAEYTDSGVDFAQACTLVVAGFSPILKDRDLTSSLETCP